LGIAPYNGKFYKISLNPVMTLIITRMTAMHLPF